VVDVVEDVVHDVKVRPWRRGGGNKDGNFDAALRALRQAADVPLGPQAAGIPAVGIRIGVGKVRPRRKVIADQDVVLKAAVNYCCRS
jgi:hypothetical protein